MYPQQVFMSLRLEIAQNQLDDFILRCEHNTFNALVFKIFINLDRDKNNILKTNEESVSSIIFQNVAELSGSKKLVMVLECLCQSDYLLVSNLKKIFQEFDNFPMSWINKTICDFKLLLSHIYK